MVLVGNRNARVKLQDFEVKRRAITRWILNRLNGRAYSELTLIGLGRLLYKQDNNI